jgi:hypothetical protein
VIGIHRLEPRRSAQPLQSCRLLSRTRARQNPEGAFQLLQYGQQEECVRVFGVRTQKEPSGSFNSHIKRKPYRAAFIIFLRAVHFTDHNNRSSIELGFLTVWKLRERSSGSLNRQIARIDFQRSGSESSPFAYVFQYFCTLRTIQLHP